LKGRLTIERKYPDSKRRVEIFDNYHLNRLYIDQIDTKSDFTNNMIIALLVKCRSNQVFRVAGHILLLLLIRRLVLIFTVVLICENSLRVKPRVKVYLLNPGRHLCKEPLQLPGHCRCGRNTKSKRRPLLINNFTFLRSEKNPNRFYLTSEFNSIHNLHKIYVNLRSQTYLDFGSMVCEK
jgi:hypothetical protein